MVTVVGILLLWGSLGLIGLFLYRSGAQRERALGRLTEVTDNPGSATRPPADRTAVVTTPSAAQRDAESLEVRSARRVVRRWILVPWLIGVAFAIALFGVTGWPAQYVLAIAIVVALLLGQLEGFLHARHLANLERQLADTIDIMVGAVGAGAAVGPAINAAIDETSRPLKPYLEEIAGRIRLGDDPVAVFRSLSERIPLETFLLFSSAMAVHYEVGGRLAPTLATVGRTIRDRIEVTRRIQSNIAQSQFSTFAIIGLIYLIAVIVWRNGPEAMVEFVRSSAGSYFVAGSIILQAAGIVWMNLISKPRF